MGAVQKKPAASVAVCMKREAQVLKELGPAYASRGNKAPEYDTYATDEIVEVCMADTKRKTSNLDEHSHFD